MVRTTERDLDAIAKEVSPGVWQAGPDNTRGKSVGEFISPRYAKIARGVRKWHNDVARVQRSQQIDDRNDAMQLVRDYRTQKDAFEKGEISQAEFIEWIQENIES